ncbi:beta-N-acetylhexosaminidase [Aurantivibrio plasticivorans]
MAVSLAGTPLKLGPVMVDLIGTEITKDDRALLLNPLVGGVIFFARNIESREQIFALVSAVRDIRPELLLAVDQEGGRVQRLRDGYTRLPPMQAFLPLYRTNQEHTLGLVKDCGWLMASEVLATGMDFSFAPVLDVDDAYCSVIADRSFSNKPEEVVELASAFLAGMHEAGMATTGKHFPGHGSVVGDSHLELPVDDRPMDDIKARDLVPFMRLQHELDAVMPAHIVFSDVDPMPVGFSSKWLQEFLRGDLAYQGVIFSDDLDMAGARSAGSFTDRARQALAAGCDMVLVCNNRDGANEVVAGLEGQALEPSPRLASMKARHEVSWAELLASTRWQHVRESLAELTQQKEII